MIGQIRNEFIEISRKYYDKTGYDYWNNHVKYVVDISKKLASAVDANKEIVEISAILHDIAKPLEIGEDKNHNAVGADISNEILAKYPIDKSKITKIVKCILHHSGMVNEKEMSKEEWCVRNADILSILNNISIFYYLAFKEYSLGFDEGRNYVKKMITSKIVNLDKKLYTEYKYKIDALIKMI